ncbi:class I SAM-dependent methyltransferase [Rhodopirellula sp. P2]|uniref:class I SAM-dependent methyltransferase n=1 Tax=Rhodopirellula sp. P2 TaxID=2127060 RepID=UPI002367F483|nr:methyltransferase domain-containing protein [Rhodopirellula sp. P2]WDQ16455.1 methyltransferase domain-containing protein [Rhodopirellula sp. P2]
MSSNPAQQFYDRISHAYDLIADGGEHAARERGLELLAPQTAESVLEIGFGTGHSLLTIAETVGPEGNVTGIDISPGMKDVAAKRLDKAGLTDRVKLIVAEAPPLPFENDAFDAVTMSFTLELFAKEQIPAVLAECRRVLKPGGRLGVVSMATVPESDRESVLEKTYVWMHTHFPHIVDCQPIPLETLVESAGFEIANQERVDLFTMPVAIVVGLNP